MACSLLGVSYRAFNVSSVLDVAYMVPHSASQPDGLLICAMHASKAFTPSQAYSNAVVLSVEEGGSQFAQGDTRYLSLPENKIDNAPFFTPARTYNLRPVEIGTVEDVLATDARFAVRARHTQRKRETVFSRRKRATHQTHTHTKQIYIYRTHSLCLALTTLSSTRTVQVCKASFSMPRHQAKASRHSSSTPIPPTVSTIRTGEVETVHC